MKDSLKYSIPSKNHRNHQTVEATIALVANRTQQMAKCRKATVSLRKRRIFALMVGLLTSMISLTATKHTTTLLPGVQPF